VYKYPNNLSQGNYNTVSHLILAANILTTDSGSPDQTILFWDVQAGN